MKKVYYLLLSITALLNLPAIAQTKFDASGKLTELTLEKNKEKNEIKDFETSTLASADATGKLKVREIMMEKIQQAIYKLENTENADVEPLLTYIWTTPDEKRMYIADLKALKAYLKDDKVSAQAFTYLGSIKTFIDHHLLSTSTNMYSLKPANRSAEPHKAAFWKKDVFNYFTTDYYESTFSSAPNEIKSLSLGTLLTWEHDLTDQYKKVKFFSKRLQESERPVKISLYDSIVTFISTINDSSNTFHKLKGLIQKDWFKQWFWYKGGEFSLNPLDFSTKEFLEKFPQYDLEKGELFDQYIDSVIRKYMLYDTIGKIEDFKKILNQRKSGNIQFEMEQRKQRSQDHSVAQAKLLQKDIFLNQIEVPAEGRFYNYSAEGKITSGDNSDKFLNDAARETTEKYLVVHNVTEDKTVDIAITSTPIKDQSKFQETTDTLAGLIAQVAAYNTPLGFIGTAIAGLTKSTSTSVKMIRPGIDPPGVSNKASVAVFNFPGYVRRLIEAEGLFNQQIFEAIIASDNDYNRPDRDVGVTDANYEKVPWLRPLVDKFTKQYVEALRKFQDENGIKDFYRDSVILRHLIKIFANGTIPPKTLQPVEDKTPAYSSQVLHTPQSDEPSKKEVRIFSVTDKKADTTTIGKFSYKVGKNYRFQYSAGLAYTIPGFIASKAAKDSTGQIVFSNSTQQYRFVVGFHVHLGDGLFLQDNQFGGKFLERSSIYLGVAIPKPLENVYVGYSYDLYPGFKLTCGAHIYRNDKYTILNNSIMEEKVRYNITAPFVAVQIDPASVLKAFNIFSK